MTRATLRGTIHRDPQRYIASTARELLPPWAPLALLVAAVLARMVAW